ncbi:MAG: [Fe-S]-binding protein, partial [Pirellulales bacterium]|nr:[Fe-S]-binding protein [Pirellulales bacterium]
MSAIPIPTDLPPLVRIEQTFPRPQVDDAAATTHAALSAHAGLIKPGQSVAIAVGSRGIDRIAQVVAATVAWVRDQQAEPFIVPAMGSHGGATAEGQQAVLASYGVTEENVGAPVRSSMETIQLPQG